MTPRPRYVIVVLTLILGLVGCDGGTSPTAPSRVIQPDSPPPANREGYTLTPSPTTVTPGGALKVSWSASRGGANDWIGLFRVGAQNCDHGWAESTKGAPSGTLALAAPTQLGEYEFRYHLNDGCVEAARSRPVTVGAGS